MLGKGNASLEQTFSAEASQLKLIRTSVRDFLNSVSASESDISDVVLAVDEACQNIIRHAYTEYEQGTIDLLLKLTNTELTVELLDYAPAVDPSCCEPKECEALVPGGLGNLFINKTMDSIGYQCPPEGIGNKLVMQKSLTFHKE